MAKTFKFGENGKWATKTGSSLAYNDQNDNFKPMPFSVTRDSIATRVNKEGLIEVVGKDKLRIDYTNSTKGVALLEPSRTNTFLHSEDFSNSVWTTISSGETIVANSVTSPDGTQNADTLEGDGTATNVFIRQDVTLTTSTDYTFSIFAKKGTNNFLAIATGGFTGSTNTVVIFDLENSVVPTGTGSIEDYGNGWLRCIFTTSISTDGTGRFLIYPSYSGTTRAFPSASDADGQNIYVWGAQLEQGSYSTSLIPTSGSTAQRQSDVANGAGNSEVFNDSEGVLFANIAALHDDLTFRIISICNGSVNQRVVIRYRTSSNTINGLITAGAGNNVLNQALAVSDQTLFSKVALKYKSGDVAIWINGFERFADDPTFNLSGLNQLNFDRGDGGDDFEGKTKEIGVYDAVLTDAELEALTSYTSFTNMANELNLTIK